MNEQLEQLIAMVKHGADQQARAIEDLSKAVDAGNRQELIMDGINLLLDKERKSQNKKELDDVEDRINETNDRLDETNSILNDIRSGLAAWSQAWTDLFSSLKQTADDQLRISNQQLRLEDKSSKVLEASAIADEEARREAARAEEASPNSQLFKDSLQQGRDERGEMPLMKMGGGSLFSMFATIAAVGSIAKLFDVDEFMRIPAYFVTFNKQLTSLGKTVLSIGPLVKSMYASFKAFITPAKTFPIYIESVAKIFKSITSVFGKAASVLGKAGGFLKSIGSSVAAFFKTSSTIAKVIAPIGQLLGKLALPITVIMGILDGIGGFMRGYAETGSILTGIREGFVGILDGLVGTLMRFAGDIIAFIPDILGLDAVAETIKDLFDNVTDGFLDVFRGLLDVVLGLLSFDLERIGGGLKSFFGGFFKTVTELLFAPFNFVINFFRDIFGFSEEDAPAFRLQDLIGDTISSIVDWFKNLFDFELPSWKEVRQAILPSWLGGGEDREAETQKLEQDVRNAREDANELRSAFAVSEDGSQLATSTSTERTYEQDIAASEQLILDQGNKVATPEQREQMQIAADDRVAQAQAALEEYQNVSSVVSAVQPMSIFKSVGNLFDGMFDKGEEEPASAKRGMVIPRQGQTVKQAGFVGGSLALDESFDFVSSIKEKALGIFDPISNAFSEITSFVKDIFNVGKITDMIGSLFSGIGVPRVEFNLPLIGSVGFGPFYPFGEGSTPVKEPAKDTVKIDDGAESSSGNLTAGEMRRLENQTEPGKRDFNNPLRSLLDDYRFTDNQQELQDKELAGYLQRSQEAKAAFEAFESGDRGSFKMVEDEFGFGEEKVYDDAAEQEKFEQLRKEKAGAENKFRRASGIATSEYFEQIEFLKDRGVITSEPGTYSFSGQQLQQMMLDYLENVQLDTPTAAAPEVSPEVSEQVTPEAVGFKYPVTDYDGNLIAVVDTPEEAAEVAMKNKGIIRNPVTASADLGPIVDTAVDNVVSSTQPSDETGSAEARPMTDEELIEFYENFIEQHKRKLERAKEEDDIGAASTYRNQIDDMEFRLKHLKEKAAGTAEPPPDLTYDPSKDQYTDELFEESSDQPDNVSLINTPDTTEAAEAIVSAAADEVTAEPKDTFLPSQSPTGTRIITETLPDGTVIETTGTIKAPEYDPSKDYGTEELFDNVEPTPSRALSAPVGQASQEVAADKGTQNNIAVTPVNNVNTSSNVNNNYNTTNISGSTPSRSTDPTFQRMQNANFGGI